MINKQIKTIVILLVTVAVLVGAFFAVKPLLEEDAEQDLEFDADGDRLGTSDRPFIYDVIAHDEVESIFIKNDVDSYKFNMDKTAGNLILEGGEDLVFDAEKLSYLYVCTCNMLAMAKVENPSEDLSVYGLEKGKDGKYFEVKTTDGETYTVYIGDVLPTGAAYYCKYENKPHIYVMSNLMESTVLSDRTAYISPLLCAPVPENDYYGIENLRIVKNGELFVEFQKESEEHRDESAVASSHRMTYPAAYNPTTELDGILNLFVNFQGSRVVEVGLNEDNVEKYGLANPSAEIIMTYSGEERRVIFGAKTQDGLSYYAYNTSHDTIIEVPTETVYFLDWDLIRFVSNSIFQMKIDSIDTLSLKANGIDKTYKLTGEGKELVVCDLADNKVIDTYSFRQFYIDVLMTSIEDYADAPSPLSEYARLTVNSRSGRTYDFVFYDLTTRRCYFTLNGVGEFCVNRDNVDKMINNIGKIIRGEAFKSEVLN